MKKVSLMLAVGLMLVPVVSFAGAGTAGTTNYVSAAAASITGTKTGGTAQPMGQLSANVILDCNFTTSSFVAATKHLNGTKEFGSSSTDAKMWSKDLAAGTASPTSVSSSAGATYFATGWTAQ